MVLLLGKLMLKGVNIKSMQRSVLAAATETKLGSERFPSTINTKYFCQASRLNMNVKTLYITSHIVRGIGTSNRKSLDEGTCPPFNLFQGYSVIFAIFTI